MSKNANEILNATLECTMTLPISEHGHSEPRVMAVVQTTSGYGWVKYNAILLPPGENAVIGFRVIIDDGKTYPILQTWDEREYPIRDWQSWTRDQYCDKVIALITRAKDGPIAKSEFDNFVNFWHFPQQGEWLYEVMEAVEVGQRVYRFFLRDRRKVGVVDVTNLPGGKPKEVRAYRKRGQCDVVMQFLSPDGRMSRPTNPVTPVWLNDDQLDEWRRGRFTVVTSLSE